MGAMRWRAGPGKAARLRWAGALWGLAARASAGAGGAIGSRRLLLASMAVCLVALALGVVLALAALFGQGEPVGGWLPGRAGELWRGAFERGLGKWVAGALVMAVAMALALGVSAWASLCALTTRALVMGANRAGERAKLSESQARALSEAIEIERAVGSKGASGEERAKGGGRRL